MASAMILCAGLGTRLGPLGAWRAKPLLPVGDRPALAHVLARVAPLGGAIVVNAHHRADDLRRFARAYAAGAIAVSEEAELLGTAGGVARAAPLLGDGDVLVWNGDILVDLDAPALVAAHVAGGAEATLAVAPRAAGEGTVGIDDAGRVVRLRGESFGAEARGGDFVGVHVVGAALRASIPARGCLVGDLYLPALRRGARLRAQPAPAAFFDIGTPRRYLEANLGWLRGRGAWAHASARVADDVRLDASVIGEGAIVGGAGALARVVVWPGARVDAPLEDAIVAPEGALRVGGDR